MQLNAILAANIQLAARTSGATRSQSRTRDFFNEGFASCGKSLLVLYTKSTEEFHINLINPIIPLCFDMHIQAYSLSVSFMINK